MIENLTERAREEGLPPETVDEIVYDALEEGVDPERLDEVGEEALRVEREDLDARGLEDLDDEEAEDLGVRELGAEDEGDVYVERDEDEE